MTIEEQIIDKKVGYCSDIDAINTALKKRQGFEQGESNYLKDQAIVSSTPVASDPSGRRFFKKGLNIMERIDQRARGCYFQFCEVLMREER